LIASTFGHHAVVGGDHEDDDVVTWRRARIAVKAS